MKRILRIIVALIFIASGFVKAVDPVGFSFKLEEYFAPGVFNMPFFEKQALTLAVLVVLIELVFGFMLLLRIRLKQTLVVLIALCVFFAFLTFYSAYFDVVTDCGCFGDALKFTPWQSFWKDIVLLIALLILWMLYRKDFTAANNGKSRFSGLMVLMIAMVFVIWHGMAKEPLIDFRHYKIGTDMNVEKAKIKAQPSEYKTFYVLKNTKTGETIDINQDEYVNKEEYWKEGSPWKIEEGKTTSKITKKGYDSEIVKFKPETSDGVDLTDEILSAPKAVLIFSYDPQHAPRDIMDAAEAKLKTEKDAYILGISNNPNTFKTINNAVMDGTAIKTIARSNPFILILKKGKIVNKLPAKEFVSE